MADKDPRWDMLGVLEDGPIIDDKPSMVVRMLGQKIGTASGWLHFCGHCIAMPDFIPEQLFRDMFPSAIPTIDQQGKDLMVLLDYYTGRVALATMPLPNGPATYLWDADIVLIKKEM